MFEYDGEAGLIVGENTTDEDGNPTGGWVEAVGIRIDWQDGPRRLEDGSMAEATGAFIEDLLTIAVERMEFYQASKFACRENAIIITKLQEAQHWARHRREDRARRGVLGAHEVSP